jgi:hypothetical protein
MSPWPEGVPDEIVNDEDVAPPCLRYPDECGGMEPLCEWPDCAPPRSEPLDSVWR